MFLRSVKAPNGRHEYLRRVESFRDGVKVKQRIVAHLGRKDLLAPHLGTWIRLLQSDQAAPHWVAVDDISTPRASTWGPILVARHLFDKLSLGSILANRFSDAASLCRNGSFRCWPTGSPAPAASMPWHRGWKISMSAIRPAVAGHRCGNSRTG